ncbi:BMP family ABC transporter substrate-binding protein (plasmid) [Kitasatospora sp. NBC_00070]|uniref:BMP family lipoprotein n=1 Tax=Kitasatospora sp. NBC_00070 TaxID=2975962 RepID=UPI002F90B6FD
MRRPAAISVFVAAVLLTGACGDEVRGGRFTACMVADTGGLDDKSFNAEAYAGVQQAARVDPSIEVREQTAGAAADYAPLIDAFVSQGCGLIVTVGVAMSEATQQSARTHPSQHYAIVDGKSVAPVVKGIQFNAAQSAFLAGYVAASMTRTGKVATFGGVDIPGVRIFMDGYWEGVQYYNKEHQADVQVLGWHEPTQSGTFPSPQSFTDPAAGRQLTAAFQAQGADIVLPVAGTTGLGALMRAKESGGTLSAIWVENDGYHSNPDYSSVIMTSVVRNIASAVGTVVAAAAGGHHNTASYIGDLANNGTGMAPFHDYASSVPSTLQSELDVIRQGIINGSIPITSPNQPTP